MLNLKDSAEARFWYHNVSAGVLAWLLGTVVGAELQPYLWLLLGRPLAAFAVTLLPPTTAGEVRPYLTAAALFGLGLVNLLDPRGGVLAVCVVLLCLLCDVAVDGVSAAYCKDTERLGRLAQGILARGCGLGLGLLCAPFVTEWPEISRSPLSYPMLALALLWALIPEQPDRTSWRARREGQEVRRTAAYDTFAAYRDRPMIAALAVLFAVAVLSGTFGVTLSPLAILSPSLLSEWLAFPLQWLGAVSACAMLAMTLERLSNRLLLALSFPLLLACSGLRVAGGGEPYLTPVLWMSAGLAMLVACRRLVAVPLRSRYLQAAIPLTVWSLGLLAGQTPTDKSSLLLLRIASAVVMVVSTLWTVRNWGTASRITSESVDDEKRTGRGRHGDRKFDFEAAPAAPGRRRPGRYLARLWFFLTIRFPVTFVMVVLGSFALAALMHSGEAKKAWQQRAESMWKAMQTELFLSSLKRRLEEEMLASNRVPKDWAQFVAHNFELDGRPLKDRDFWGTPLQFTTLPREIHIVSAGPDRKHGTKDDLERYAVKPDGVQ